MFEQLLRERIILIGEPITDDRANIIIAQLLFLHSENPGAPIRLAIKSPGGHVSASLAIYDTMGDLGSPVHTHCLEEAAGTALLLLAHGVRGQRTANPRAFFTLTPIAAGYGPIDVRDLERTEQTMCELMAADTQRAIDTIRADMRGGRTFEVNDATAYGLIDRVEAFDLSAIAR